MALTATGAEVSSLKDSRKWRRGYSFAARAAQSEPGPDTDLGTDLSWASDLSYRIMIINILLTVPGTLRALIYFTATLLLYR